MSAVAILDPPFDLRDVFVGRVDDFNRGLIKHLLSYALGRKLEYFDTPAVEAIVDRTIENDCRLSTMVTEIVNSYPFRFTNR